MEEVFKLSRRKGSSKWQVRKRWPSDVKPILKGEFTASTGEEEKAKAQDKLVVVAAEYQRRVAEARAKLVEEPKRDISEAEAAHLAAQFYRRLLPSFVVRKAMSPIEHASLLKDTKERLGTLKEMLGRNEFGAVAGVAREMAKQAGAELPEDSPSWDHLHRVLMRAMIELNAMAVAKLSGEPDYEPKIDLDIATPSGHQQHTIEDLIAAYEADKGPRWSGSSKKAVVPVFRLLRDVFPDREAASITRAEARDTVALLEELPTNLGKRKELKGLGVPEAVRRNAKLGFPTIAPKTINDAYLMHISSMFNWARKEQWVQSNPFEGLSVHDPVDDADRRDPFTIAQLNAVFSLGLWERAWENDGRRAGDFWVPLLCLFHGLRNGEAAGLRVQDVDEAEGHSVVHLRAYDNRSLKTADARGTLPVHPELMSMGFLQYVERRRETGELLLFPEGTANSRGQVGAKLAERFSSGIKSFGFEGKKLGMHSFRHNFEDRLREAGLPPRTALALARRRESGTAAGYGEGLSVAAKAAAIGKIVYPDLQIEHLWHRLA